MVNKMNNYFSPVFTIEQLNNIPQLGQYEFNILDTFNFSTEEVQEKLLDLNTPPDLDLGGPGGTYARGAPLKQKLNKNFRWLSIGKSNHSLFIILRLVTTGDQQLIIFYFFNTKMTNKFWQKFNHKEILIYYKKWLQT